MSWYVVMQVISLELALGWEKQNRLRQNEICVYQYTEPSFLVDPIHCLITWRSNQYYCGSGWGEIAGGE